MKAQQIPVVKFNRRKYGDELLIDIVTLETIRRSPQFANVQRQAFYGIMLTIGGEGVVEVDDHRWHVSKGLVACAKPGDVCTVIEDNGLTSLELIFERDFLISFFNDAHFLDGIAFLSPQRSSPYLWLNEQLYNRIVGLYDSILVELQGSGKKDAHLLRAMLYEVLMLLQKASPVDNEGMAETDRMSRFRQLVDENYLTENGVEFYADRLCVTSNYLNRLVRQSFGKSTKQYIQNRRIEEAKRLLRYTSLSVADIAERLCFDTSSYFVRAFSRLTGKTPLQYRNCPEK